MPFKLFKSNEKSDLILKIMSFIIHDVIVVMALMRKVINLGHVQHIKGVSERKSHTLLNFTLFIVRNGIKQNNHAGLIEKPC